MEKWYARATGCGGQALVISEKDGRNVAVAYEEKDAPLLAAAPEMLETLKKVNILFVRYSKAGKMRRDHSFYPHVNENVISPLHKRVRTIIAKAEGKTKAEEENE